MKEQTGTLLCPIINYYMCGITGQLLFGAHHVDQALVKRMTRRLAHRGPDASGYYFGNRIGMGHRRLAIIDLKRGRQPMLNRDQTLCIVANNEIYNHLELRAELESKGSRFSTNSDTEVILQLFQREREKSFAKLEGMFALAIWDVVSETLFLARDPFGIKPLYYYQDEDTLLFASEMKSLLEYPSLNRRLDLAALDSYFGSLSLPEPHTVFRNVKKLPPGHFIKVSKGHLQLQRFWRPRFTGSKTHPRPQILSEQVRKELQRSVKISLRSDVPVGVLLSGGLDSSTIAAFASRENGSRLHTFSVAFKEDEFNESSFSRIVSKAFRTRHHEIVVTKKRATEIASRLTKLIDEPFADCSSIPTYAVCELASGYVKTVLSGEGADELFGGYPWHTTKNQARQEEHPAKVIFSRDERTELYSSEWRQELRKLRLNLHTRSPHSLSPLNQSLLADLRFYLPSDILFKSDRVSMIHSLEIRVPFLNRQFAELAMALPDKMKVDRSQRKVLLKQMMRGVLPDCVLDRPKKGFSIPLDLWLWEKGAWRDMIYDTIFSRTTREREQFKMRTLERMQQEHERLQGLHGYKLWTVFAFEMWQREFLD